jgi:hypothetical protein
MRIVNPYLVREEAERIIGEDRVPTAVLQNLIDTFGPVNRGAETVRVVTENFARLHGDNAVLTIEEDHNEPPGGTSPYEGRALAFQFEVDGIELRVLVEDVTVDLEER